MSFIGYIYCVFYLVMSLDGWVVVIGVGDEIFCFWFVFGRRLGMCEDGESGGSKFNDWGVIC